VPELYTIDPTPYTLYRLAFRIFNLIASAIEKYRNFMKLKLERRKVSK
jgi:hypothetical protein